MNRAAKEYAQYRADVAHTIPETPLMQWTCPICSARQPSGVAFCVHVIAAEAPESDLHLPAPRFKLDDDSEMRKS